ncbi:MAG: carboxypeptidase regulatory-like domain-containing protein [Acidobacteria bacterium]|nr:carboxypeptidase regulatory-like domain-containing protein [Acidobacteriota bacterium]
MSLAPVVISRRVMPALLALCLLAPVIFAQGPPAGPPPKEPARPKGTITGRVIGEDGQPIANARVVAEAQRSNRGVGALAITGPDGKFRIENLERGAYSVRGHVPAHFDASYLEYERGVRAFYRLGDTVAITMLKGGVITGRVTDAKGEPVMGTRVNMVRVRTLEGRAVREVNRFMGSLERLTDDRGVFRNYGLLPGVYVVSAGGKFSMGYRATPHGDEAPTFHPSATRDNATEVTVRTGEEAGGVDVRLRQEGGHTVSGTVEGVGDAAHAEYITEVRFIAASNTEYQGHLLFYGRATSGEGFAFESLTDGEYDLVALRYQINGGKVLGGAAQRVSVRGTDVQGLKITFAPLASISGRIVLENPPAAASPQTKMPTTTTTTHSAVAPACREKPDALLDGAVIIVRREGAGSQADAAVQTATIARESAVREAAPDEKGEFTFQGLRGLRYRLEVRLGESFYVSSIRQKGAAGPQPAQVTRQPQPRGDVLRLRAGESLSGVVVTALHGAASLRGRIVAAAIAHAAGSPTPEASRVYLVPQERERAEDPARFAESEIAEDGGFAFEGLAPGRYWLLVRTAPTAPADAFGLKHSSEHPLFWLEAERVRLRREAEAAANSVTLSPCQRVEDYSLRPAPKN